MIENFEYKATGSDLYECTGTYDSRKVHIELDRLQVNIKFAAAGFYPHQEEALGKFLRAIFLNKLKTNL